MLVVLCDSRSGVCAMSLHLCALTIPVSNCKQLPLPDCVTQADLTLSSQCS